METSPTPRPRRGDSVETDTRRRYDCSAHLLWVGERTRQPGMAHFEFVRGIQNPVGVKISDKASPADVLEILDTFNPKNVPGKVTLITRMSADKLRTHLPPILEAVQREGRAALWVCDPVHGNTYTSSNGYKTRDFDAIRAEIEAFFDVHEQCGTHAGGIHLEMTGKDVTECVGGGVNAARRRAATNRRVGPDPTFAKILTRCSGTRPLHAGSSGPHHSMSSSPRSFVRSARSVALGISTSRPAASPRSAPKSASRIHHDVWLPHR